MLAVDFLPKMRKLKSLLTRNGAKSKFAPIVTKYCLDPKGKKRYENDAGIFVPLLTSKGKSNLDQETGLVM